MKKKHATHLAVILGILSLAALSPAPIHDGSSKNPAPVKTEPERQIDQTRQRTQTEVGAVEPVDRGATVSPQMADPTGAAIVKDSIDARQAQNAKLSLQEAEEELERERIHKEILLMWLLGVLTVVGTGFYAFRRWADTSIPIPFTVQARQNEHLAKQRNV